MARPAVKALAKYHRTSSDPLIGKIIDAGDADPPAFYRIERRIGIGGMGTVYMAHDTRDNSVWAIKFLKTEFSEMGSDKDMRDRFLREARVLMQVKHENVVRVKHVGMHEDRLYIVMEYLDGKDLSKVMAKTFEKKPGLSWSSAKPILLKVCDALEAIHAKGIIHRDLAPKNIMIMRSEEGIEIKLLDFGLAKFLREKDNITQTGTFLGTPTYTAPEQATGNKNYDKRVDIYALGVMMYEMMVGVVPFKGENNYATVKDHMETPPIPPRLRNPKANIPKGVEKIIMKALQKNPNDRFKSITEMKEAIADDGKHGSYEDIILEQALGTTELKIPEEDSIGTVGIADYSYTDDEVALSRDGLQTTKPKKKGWVGKTLLILALLAGLGSAGYYYREAIVEKVQEIGQGMKEKQPNGREGSASEERARVPYKVRVQTRRGGVIVRVNGVNVYIEEKMGGNTVRRPLGRVSKTRTLTLPPGSHTLIISKRGQPSKRYRVSPSTGTIVVDVQ